MKTSIFKISYFLPLLFLLNSCADVPWNCVEGNGRIAYEERIIGDFRNIVSYGSFVVEVSLRDNPGLAIETDENLLPYVNTYVQGSSLVLEVRNNRCIRSREPIMVYVDAVQVEKLKLSGSGVINCDNISGESLEIELPGSGRISSGNLDVNYVTASIPGSGEIELSGSAGTSDFTISGSGSIKAINLDTDRCFASIPGSGTIYISVYELLDVDISGSGSLYYHGDPEIISSISGSGSIREYK